MVITGEKPLKKERFFDVVREKARLELQSNGPFSIGKAVRFVSRKRPFLPCKSDSSVKKDRFVRFFVRLRDPTRTHIQSQKLVASTGCDSRIAQSKTFMNPCHRSSHHQNTRTHTPIHLYQVPQLTVSYNNADTGLAAVTAAASRRKPAWPIPRPVRHQRALCDGRWQQSAISTTFSQQRLRWLWLWRLSVECNDTNVALAALGQVQRHQPAWPRDRRA